MKQIKLNVYEDSIMFDRHYYHEYGMKMPDRGETIEIHFAFSPDWDSYTKKVAGFWDRNREECRAQVISEDNTCVVPAKALEDFIFYVEVLGKRGDIIRHTERRAIVFSGR